MDFGAFFLFGSGVIALLVCLMAFPFAATPERRRARLRRAGWLMLFLVMWGCWIYQSYFLDEDVVEACSVHNYSKAETLLKRGAAPGASDERGNSCLVLAGGDARLVSLLLHYHANPNAHDENGKTALDHAREKHDTAAAALLEKAMSAGKQ